MMTPTTSVTTVRPIVFTSATVTAESALLMQRTARVSARSNSPGIPEAFILEKQGRRIFVNVPAARHVVVIDRDKGEQVAAWRTDGAFANFPIALDEANHPLFIGCRRPAKMVVLNTDTGSVVTSIAISGDTDDIFYDAKRHRLYAICGDGNVEVIEQIDPGKYKVAATIPTAPGARTGFFVSELDSLFVAIPRRGSQVAEVRRFAIE